MRDCCYLKVGGASDSIREDIKAKARAIKRAKPIAKTAY